MEKLDRLMRRIMEDVRVYHGLVGYMEDIECVSGEGYVRRLETVSEEDQEVIFACRHQVFRPPSFFSLKGYRPFGFSLPVDVLYFFSKFARVFLWSHRDYTIGIPGRMEAHSLDETLPYPYAVLRFCRVDLPDACYFALRTKNGGGYWDVVFVRNVASDLEEAMTNPPLYCCFTEWLSDIVESDGWTPLMQGLTEDWNIIVMRQLSKKEIEKNYDEIRRLLPPVTLAEWKIDSEDP